MRTATRLLLALTLASILQGCASRPDDYILESGGVRFSKDQAENELVQRSLRPQVKPPLDSPLRLLHVELPSYPKQWKRLGNVPEMQVTVAFSVAETGAVNKATLVGAANP